MSLHIVHFIGPINATSACTVRNLCLQALQSGATEIELHMSTEGGNMTAGFALYFFLTGQKRYACPGTRFLIHPLQWGFGNLVAADHARTSEWRDCLNFDAERYAAVFDEATRGAPAPEDIRHYLTGSSRLYTADEAVAAGIVHAARQAQLPPAGVTSHWWN
jgi:ATP-dependent Clp protease protease subunit